MASVKEVVIEIDPDGTTRIEAQNFKGKGCAEATAMLELALGGTDPGNKSDKRKPEFAMNPGSCIPTRNWNR